MNTLRSLILASTLVVAGCQTTSTATQSSTTTPTPVTDTQAAIPRFTNDIWPAVAAYNADPSQGNPGGVNPAYARYLTVVDKGLDPDAWGKLRGAVQHLGVLGDEAQGDPMRDESGLHLANARLAAETSSAATLDICYTFTALSYHGQEPVRTPTASEAAVELSKTDNWYLHAITNDHVVPSCPSNGT